MQWSLFTAQLMSSTMLCHWHVNLDDKLKKAPQVIIYYACNLNGLSFSLCAVYENNITLIRIEVLHRQMCSALTARLFAILIMCIVV